MGLIALNPSTNPVQLGDLKTSLRVVDDLSNPDGTTYSSDDAALAMYLAAALDHIETETRQQLLTRSFTRTLDGFPGQHSFERRHPIAFDRDGRQTITLPKPPLQRVSTVQYLDATGTLQTLSPSSYVVDASQKPGRIVLRPGYSWPATDGSAGCVQISFTAGYDGAADCPNILKQSILLLAGTWYEFREDTVALRISTIPIGVQAIINANSFPEAVS